MDRKKVMKTAVIGVLLLSFCFLITAPIHADVGNSFSGGGGGHSSGGGGGYSHSYGGSGGLSGIFFLSSSPIGIVVLVLLVLYAVYNMRKGKGTANTYTYANPGIKSNEGIFEEEIIARIQEEDPAFSAENFRNYASEVWLTLQEAWEAKDWHKVRPFESNTLFNVHNRQLQEYIDHHKTNYMNMQNVRGITIASYSSDDEHEIIHVKLDASLLDYVVDDDSGKVLEGSKTDYVYRSYNLEFIRKKGIKTKEQEGTAVTNCPNCGAPTTVTSSGQCEYCKSIITNGDFGWVLNRYSPW